MDNSTTFKKKIQWPKKSVSIIYRVTPTYSTGATQVLTMAMSLMTKLTTIAGTRRHWNDINTRRNNTNSSVIKWLPMTRR